MNFLVTGGSGFLGNNLCRYLLKEYPKSLVVNYSKTTYAVNPLSMKDLEKEKNYRFIPGDINNKLLFQKTLKKFKIEVVFSLAASTHVDRSFLFVEEFLRTNVLGIYSLLEVLRYLEKKPLYIHMSTDEVLGDAPKGVYYTEESPLKPQNPYSASKASGEMLCLAYYHSFKVPVIIVRSMNLYGPYQHPEKLIAKIITNALKRKKFTLYKGESIRGWNYVKDTCEILDLIRTKGKTGEIYHIPPSCYKSVPEVAKSILKIIGKEDCLIGFRGRRLKDDFRYALDGTKVTYELDWRPKTDWETGIRKTIKWYKENEWFWKDKF